MIKDPSNIVKLTYREHYICHWLLTKIYPSKEMAFAFVMMNGNNKEYINSWGYKKSREEWSKYNHFCGSDNSMFGKHQTEDAKKKISDAMKAKCSSEEYRKMMSERATGSKNGMYGRHHSKETIDKLKEVNTGRVKTKEEIEKIRQSHIGKIRTEEQRKHISDALKGRIFSEEHRKHIGEKSKGRHWNLTEENKMNMSLAQKGKRKGWMFWNNGKENVFAPSCPGEGWNKGRLKK